MKVRPVTAFLMALAAIVLALAAVAVIQSRIESIPTIDLEGDWLLTHLVQWGPYKSWTFRYRLSLSGEGIAVSGEGETLSVNGRPPGPRERTTLQVVETILDKGYVIAWVFERNGERAGRGAIKWRVASDNRLVGSFRTTFYRGASVAQRLIPEGEEEEESAAAD
ncbi:MAG: hypothetical protein GVY22_16015 [Gammaproteobacteria bacterium]|jgi:hypothetical protein|nr:hypothetical protein [Gammaproteobacteria bacterium]